MSRVLTQAKKPVRRIAGAPYGDPCKCLARATYSLCRPGYGGLEGRNACNRQSIRRRRGQSVFFFFFFLFLSFFFFFCASCGCSSCSFISSRSFASSTNENIRHRNALT